MDQKLDTAEKKVLVELVKLVQKRGMQGTLGGWKDFLNNHDKKFGSSLSDPAKRSNDVLASFLKTFTNEDDLKFIEKVLQCSVNRDVVKQTQQMPAADESPEQRLVRLTLEHPRYLLDYKFLPSDEDWVVTKIGKQSEDIKMNTMYAVDCEMVLCEDGSEALVRVCVVDRNLEVIFNELVNPKKAVADYRSEITGVTAEDLADITCTLADIQKRMKKLLSRGAILVGHGLNNDLRALKLDHARVIDTAFIFKYADVRRRPSLKNLCKSVLGFEIRKKGSPHNCQDDACAAMKLVLSVVQHGVDNTKTLVQEDMPEFERAKLLLHRIPVSVPSEELHSVIPGEFTIELKPPKKPQGENYSAVAIFRNSQAAYQAFENVKGDEEKDSAGRPQKLVEFQSSTGVNANLYVRKMVCDDPDDHVSVKKRAFEGENNSGESKKLKADPKIKDEVMAESNECKCKDHLKEIEKLKQELGEKELQISVQDRIISNLKKKVGTMKKDKKKKRH